MLRTLGATIASAVAGFMFSLTFVGCGGSSAPPPPPPRPVASTIAIVSGNNQTGAAGQTLGDPLVARVDDQFKNPFSGASVVWTITSGGGMVGSTRTVTGQDGLTSVDWTLGPAAGDNSVTAQVGSNTVAFTAEATRTGLASIAIAPPDPPLETGAYTYLTASGTDGEGNPYPLPPLTWSSSNPAIARVTADGLLIGMGPGVATITAKGGDVVGKQSVTISAGITFSFGSQETVFHWVSDRCENLDIPDTPAHAIRLSDGSLLLIDGHETANYVMAGTDFAMLHKRCTPTLVSHHDPDAESFDNQEWLSGVYRDGGTIYALMHNEFHDAVSANCIAAVWPNICWYNSVTSASSTDGGITFTHATPPAHVAAPPRLKWNPQGTGSMSTPPPYGHFNPSNIVKKSDNYYYAVFIAIDRSSNAGLCLMRTQTLGDPASWRAWDGTGFNLQMTDPYIGSPAAQCTSVEEPANLVSEPTLTFNTYLGKYMVVGSTVIGGPTEYICGAGYTLSSDLIHWSPKHLLREAYLTADSPCPPPGDNGGTAYPSIIDHNDSTASFEKPGRTPYLYYTLFNDTGLNRDLVRVKMTITIH